MTHTLTALSPLDGRYHTQTLALQQTMSEFALIHQRVIVEIDWLITLACQPDITEAPLLNANQLQYLNQLKKEFTISNAERIKEIEKTTNHDVKAVEYYLQDAINKGPVLEKYIPFIHFGCTSEDINNVAYALMLQNARNDVLIPKLTEVLLTLDKLALTHAALPMLSRTHGQAATPTTLGKEIRNFEQRLHAQLTTLQHVKILAKFNGAVGNFNAHRVAYPDIDWPALSQHFIESLDLTYNACTAQTEPHDFIAELMHTIMRINTILIDLARDFWGYISLNYFTQRQVAHEVGSSTMPHKINPIDFENAEGNLGLANAMAAHLAEKLPISRWQRDLSDSTVLRNLGTVFGYTFIALLSLEKGLQKLEVNTDVIQKDLEQHWDLLAEPIQTVLRRYGINNAYEQLKDFSRGKSVTQKNLAQFINALDIPADVKKELAKLTPETYIGYAVELTEKRF